MIDDSEFQPNVCPDYWIAYDGTKVDVNNSWMTRGSETFWRLQPGESAVLSYLGQRFRPRKFAAGMENTGSSKYGGTFTWTITGGYHTTRLEIKDNMLP